MNEMKLKQVNGNVIDLSEVREFVAHYNNPANFAREILEECNRGDWYDECLEQLPPSALVIDAGANVGLWGLWILPKAGTIFSIEPNKNFVSLLTTWRLFFPMKQVASLAAITNNSGKGRIAINESNTTECNVIEGEGQISFYTLQRFFDLYLPKQYYYIDLLKLDIEGAEHRVILEDETSAEALKRCGIVYIETHPPPYGKTDEAAIIAKMVSLGFTHKPGRRGLSHWFIQ